MRILYFAWLRERIGKTEEELDLPPDVLTPRAVITFLNNQGPSYHAAFENMKLIRCAIGQEFCGLDEPLGEAREIAFFPPVTGG